MVSPLGAAASEGRLDPHREPTCQAARPSLLVVHRSLVMSEQASGGVCEPLGARMVASLLVRRLAWAGHAA
jgi:hypothetical protein